MAAPTPWVPPVTMKTWFSTAVPRLPRSLHRPGPEGHGRDIPFYRKNEIPVRLLHFYDIFISWSLASRGEVSDGCGVNLNEALRRAVMRTGQAAPKGGTR
jgi:hypothetical protein